MSQRVGREWFGEQHTKKIPWIYFVMVSSLLGNNKSSFFLVEVFFFITQKIWRNYVVKD